MKPNIGDRIRAREAGNIIVALVGLMHSDDSEREENILRAYVAAGGSKPKKSAFDRYLICGETYSLSEIERQTKLLIERTANKFKTNAPRT